MTTVNINRKVTDSYYRYRMPSIVAKVEGRGNGIKTVIANLSEVSKALKRPPLYPLKYIGCELGAQTISDVKHDRYIVNGAHDSDKLQNILDTFIEKYVLCGSCSNPETLLCVSAKKELITMKCIACGHTTRVSSIHRASAYILKNPPTTNTKQKSNQKKSPRSDNSKATTDNGDDEIDLFPNNTTDDHKNNNSERHMQDEHEDCQWDADVSEAAVKKRQQMLSSHLRALIVDADTNRPIHEKLEILRDFIQNKLSTNSNLDSHFDDIVNEVKRLDIEYKAIFSISSVIFDADLVSQLSRHHNFLRRFCTDQPKIQKYLLASIERIIEQYMDQLIDKVPIVFKILFEAEIIDEEVFLKWDSKRSSRFVAKETSEKIKVAAFKFMDWLKNAEEESSESEEELEQHPLKPSAAATTVTDESIGLKTSDPFNATNTNKLRNHSNGNTSDSLSTTQNSFCDTLENNENDSDINIDDI